MRTWLAVWVQRVSGGWRLGCRSDGQSPGYENAAADRQQGLVGACDVKSITTAQDQAWRGSRRACPWGRGSSGAWFELRAPASQRVLRCAPSLHPHWGSPGKPLAPVVHCRRLIPGRCRLTQGALPFTRTGGWKRTELAAKLELGPHGLRPFGQLPRGLDVGLEFGGADGVFLCRDGVSLTWLCLLDQSSFE